MDIIKPILTNRLHRVHCLNILIFKLFAFKTHEEEPAEKYTDLNSFYKTHEEEPAEKVAALLRRHRLLPVEIHNLLRTFHAVGVYVGCLDVCSGCIYMYNGCT